MSLGDAANPYTVFNYTRTAAAMGRRNSSGATRATCKSMPIRGTSVCSARATSSKSPAGHMRRKFFDAKTSDEWRSHLMLDMIRGLYEVEDEVVKLDDEAAKVRYRQQHARPLLETIAAWLKEHRDQVLPKSPLGEAIGYALNNWTALNRYVDVG